MCKLIRCYFLLLFCCCFLEVPSAEAQRDEGALKFKHFTSANGLSQRSVMAILQDKTGYQWFGTRDGLNKFDGNRFIVYRHDAANPKSLSNNNIHSLYQDNYGNLWVGTQTGLNKYNPRTDDFTRYGAADYTVRAIIQISKELIWAATENGILQVDIRTGRNTHIQSQSTDPNSFSDNSTRFFLKTKDNDIWICNTRYIDIYNPDKKTFQHLDYPRKTTNNIHFNDLPTLFTDRKNTIWLGYEQGLALYNPQTGRFTDFEFNGKTAIPSAVRSLCEDLMGNLWIGTYSGLYILNSNHTQLQHVVHDENDATSLSQNSIYKIIRDSRGDMWLGTWADGLNYYNKDIAAFKDISFGTTNNKLNYKVVSGITEDARGNLWIGTEGGGLNYYNRATQTFTYFKNEPGIKSSLSANNVKAVITDKKGNLWIGMHDGGVNFLNPSRKPFVFEQIDFATPGSIPLKGYKVLTLFEDKNGNIWIGTLTGGLCFYDVQKRALTKIDNAIRTVMSIAQTADPELLAIGGDNGLETINIRTKIKSKIILEQPVKKNTPLYVNCVFIDHFNKYWVGTEGSGVYMYDPETNKTTAYGTRQGLPNDIVYGIVADEAGNIWISTNNGISRLEVASGSIKNYNQEDGLQGNEFNYGSSFKTRSGELFFGGTNGLTYFNPEDIKKNNFVPNIDITNIEVNNLPYQRLNNAISQIELKYDQNNFSIDFTALSYMYPEKNEFAYKLEGINKDWVYVKTERKATYTNIPPGNYVFRVKGANSDGVWNERGDTLKIKILPAAWNTWWAYLIYAALLIGVLLYIRKLIALRIKERREKERIEQLNQMKLSLFTDISHDFRTPLTLIIGPLREMLDSDAGDAYVKRQHTTMYRNAGMLLQLINEVLDFSKIESTSLTLNASENNLVAFIEDVKASFDELAKKRNIDFRLITAEKEIRVWFDPVKLKKVFFNLLANAFKFTDDGSKISIRVRAAAISPDGPAGDVAEIAITNFGTVLSAEQISRIFDPFYQLEHKNRDQGSGIGLALVKKLIDLHKGSISVQSSEAAGTRFSVFLKKGTRHLSKAERVYLSEQIDTASFFVPPPVLEAPPQIEEHSPEEGAALPGLLIVEDNPELQQFIRQLFAATHTLFSAGNGKEALEIAQQNAVDLIISDVQMPVMDGFELCNAIKTNLVTSHIFVILLTAKTSPTHQEKGYSIGADAYVTKPFSPVILKVQVHNLLKTRANLILKFKKDLILEPKNFTSTTPDELFLKKAIMLVEENLDNPDFNANVFIARMYMSRTVLYTKLRALTGQNISSFIRTIRLKKAAQLMLQSNMTIAQIAYEVGFNDLKYFRESFKEFFNATPTEYKKQHARESGE